jgi:hypothetical protein
MVYNGIVEMNHFLEKEDFVVEKNLLRTHLMKIF